MIEEVWKDVVGYEGRYKASSLGRILSVKTGKFLTPCGNKYLIVGLHDGIRPKTIMVHTIIATTFLGPPPCCPTCGVKKEINHKNQDNKDNSASNLEYMTHAENIKSSYHKRRSRLKSRKLTASQVSEIRTKFDNGLHANQIAQEYGISSHYVNTLYRGKTWSDVAVPASPKRNSVPRIPPEKIQKIIEDLNAGAPPLQLTDKYNIKRSSIYRIRKNHLSRPPTLVILPQASIPATKI